VAGHILTAVGRIHQLFPALELLRPALLTGVLGLGLYVFDRHPQRRLQPVLGPPMKLLLALLFWMMLSVPAALVVGNSFEVVFNGFLKTVLMVLLVAGAVRHFRDVERLVFVYLLGAAVYALVVVLRFDLGSGADWRLGRLYYYDANDLATFLVTAMPLGLYFLHGGRRMRIRLFAVAASAMLAVTFVWTGSRGGFIALVAVGAFIVLRYSAIPLRRRVVATVLVALVVVCTASERYWTQMGTILSDADYNRTEETGRMQIWSRGIGYMLRHPLLGVGPGNFQTAEGTLSPFAERQQFGVGVRWNAAHNTFVQAGAEMGMVGLALFVGVIASAFVALRRSRQGDAVGAGQESRARLAQVLTAALIGFVVGAFFLSLAYSEMLYVLVALAVALQKVAAPKGPVAERPLPYWAAAPRTPTVGER
jgi:O-antigen ligase